MPDYDKTIQVVLCDAIEIARDLCEPGNGERNPEYERGQAELICDLFGLSMNEHRETILREIAG